VNPAATHNRLTELRMIAFDIDGVFTDGRFYLSDEGVESKAFNTQDGGRHSGAVERRMSELGVQHVFLGTRDKTADFDGLIDQLGIEADQCAYVGDDIPDLPLLERAGYSIAVANAVAAVRDYCDYTTLARGGHGAVREICDLVLDAHIGIGA
jgi:3-deoxy-D-manno-octulosonate 8-phosphate phosphatase (KDO 8-P phosphatase)